MLSALFSQEKHFIFAETELKLSVISIIFLKFMLHLERECIIIQSC